MEAGGPATLKQRGAFQADRGKTLRSASRNLPVEDQGNITLDKRAGTFTLTGTCDTQRSTKIMVGAATDDAPGEEAVAGKMVALGQSKEERRGSGMTGGNVQATPDLASETHQLCTADIPTQVGSETSSDKARQVSAGADPALKPQKDFSGLRLKEQKAAGKVSAEPPQQPSLAESEGRTEKATHVSARAYGISGIMHDALAQPALKRIQVLKEMDAEEEAAAMEREAREMLEAAKAGAEGEAGDSPKYEKAALQVENRWRLFKLLMKPLAEEEFQPTLETMKEFAVFMFTTRQNRSREERSGLGDSAVLLARYTLAQKVFPKLGYEGWQGLSTAELREKAKPFSQQLAETWIRLRRAYPEKQSSRQPFKKSKWSENAVYQAQDAVYEKIDGEAETVNSGLTRLMVMGLVRSTCQRPGAMGKDQLDLQNETVWGPDGLHVLSVKDLTWSRTGMKITMLNGATEEGASRGELKFNRLKHRYFDAAAGGYEYLMSITPDAEAVARRSPDIMKTYMWRRGLFAVQYANMSTEAIEEAVRVRCEEGYAGGMPPGAQIDEEEAVARFEAGEMNYLKMLEDEPLLVMLERGGCNAFKQQEMTARYILQVFTSVSEDAGFKPGDAGTNNMRRSTMVLVQKGAERLGFDPSMHAKRIVNHRGEGHGTREGFYEDCSNTTDMGAFIMQREVESIEGLNDVASTRCPALAKFKVPTDVPKNDPLWKLLTKNESLQLLRKAQNELCRALMHDPSEKIRADLAIVRREIRSAEHYLKAKVLYEKQKAVYESHCEALKVMPIDQVLALRATPTTPKGMSEP